MKKTIIAVILGFILVFVSNGFSANIEVPVINIPDPSVQQIIEVNISFSSEKDFVGYQFTLQYNQQVLRFLEVVKSPLTSTFTIMANANTPGFVKIAGFNANLSGLSGSGILAICRFQILQAGFSNLILSSVKLSDSNGQAIPCASLSGRIRVGQVEEKGKQSSPTASGGTRQIPIDGSSVSSPEPAIPQPAQPGIYEKPFISDAGMPEQKGSQTQEPKTKDIPSYVQPSNNVTLLVLSEYGNPIPPAGITTFEKGDRVSCSVEKEILIDDMEKTVCIGCDGFGSAPSSKNNSINFVINKDSKIIWKWKKTTIDPDFLMNISSTVFFDSSDDEVALPVRARFLGGFNKPVFLYINKNPDFDVSLTDTCLDVKKNQTFIGVKKKDKNLPVGQYNLLITAESEDKSKKLDKEIGIIISGSALLGEAVIDETAKLITFPLFVYGRLKNISSFEMRFSVSDDARFVKINAGSNETKIFSGFSQKGKNVKISGGIFPSIDLSNTKFIDIVFSFEKYSPELFTLNECSFWDENGKIIPIIVKKR